MGAAHDEVCCPLLDLPQNVVARLATYRVHEHGIHFDTGLARNRFALFEQRLAVAAQAFDDGTQIDAGSIG